ncbi:c-type cytochrome [Marinobacterium arenosum]|uniref:c-type cytochrome n=1 Tax=Marinobacterium arenosum TaxID=2862496 RepID=UPI001C953358|nr:c-type cytochrome [Marinobacterium arenosum]MBY4677577.1 cytochrome c [Marinobacterium arenosum]
MNLRRSMQASLALAAITIFSVQPVAADHFQGHVSVQVGALSAQAQQGQRVFNDNCAGCHGVNGAGTRKGPPLIHAIYNPGHHGNRSFYNAVRNGVRQHHWPYGDMPAQPQVGFADMAALIKFVRELQQQNGIAIRKHQM